MRRKEREITGKEEILKVIDAADVCRVSFADNNMPYIVTMNFGFRDGAEPELFFHCAPEGRKLKMMEKNNWVCFEMDTDHEIYKGEKGCDWGMRFKSIVGYGHLAVVKDDMERRTGLDLIMDHYGGHEKHDYDEKVLGRTLILRLKIAEMSAKFKT